MDFTTHPQAGARCLRSCPKAKRIKLCSLVLDQRDGDPFRVSMYMYATWRAQLVMEEPNTLRTIENVANSSGVFGEKKHFNPQEQSSIFPNTRKL